MLHKATKNIIATQLLQGIPSFEILDRIRDSVDSTFQRIHLTTRKDVHNISQLYSLYDKAIKHVNDAVSVNMWAKENSNGTDRCCVIQGVFLNPVQRDIGYSWGENKWF